MPCMCEVLESIPGTHGHQSAAGCGPVTLEERGKRKEEEREEI